MANWAHADLTRFLTAAATDAAPLMAWGFAIALEGGGVGRLVLNRAQRQLHQILQRQQKEGRPARAVVLKARQPGISTYCMGRLLATCLTRPYTTSCLVTHLKLSTEVMMKKPDLMLTRLPEGIRPQRPMPRKTQIPLTHIPGRDEIFPLETELIGGYAGGEEVWRGVTLQTVHLSEVAKFGGHGDDVLLGITQAVPELPTTTIILESTANGVGNTFHREWLRAESGESGYAPVFIGWWDIEKYRMALPRKGIRWSTEERELQKKYRLSDEQIMWRRWTIHNKCQGNTDKFHQEYPESPAVAFLVTGQPAFPTVQLRRQLEAARGTQYERGLFDDEGKFRATGEGLLTIYKRPVQGHDYTVGADVAAGVDGGDFSCAQVFDRNTSEFVAVWHGQMSPVGFAHICERLGYWYNTAIMGPEVNGEHGFAVVEELKKRSYQRWYVWQRVDRAGMAFSKYLGWETNLRTRGLLFDSMHWALTNDEVTFHDLPTLEDMLECSYNERNQPEGAVHDDLTMAALIAYRVHLEMPLLSTGLPPRVVLPQDAPTVEAPPAPMGGAPGSRDVWDAIDHEIATQNQEAMEQWSQWAGGDHAGGLDTVPDIPY